MKIALGVSGGIACYKAAEIVRRLQDRGFEVVVMMTKAATQFVTPLTFRALSGNKVYVDMFEGDGHDLVEINGTLEIRRNGIDGAALSESDISVAKNDDGTVSVKFPGSDDAVTVKFTGAAAEATGFDVELAGSSLIITPKTEAGIV